jgi:hypothetical protein
MTRAIQVMALALPNPFGHHGAPLLTLGGGKPLPYSLLAAICTAAGCALRCRRDLGSARALPTH